jgi:hypothetical protein
MKGKFLVAILFGSLPLIAFSGAEPSPSESYYERLKSLVRDRQNPAIRPNATERDVSLIEVEKGAAGVIFGASMDDVIAVWGLPESIRVSGFFKTWFLRIGGSYFGFVDNRLTSIAVHRAAVENAHLTNGIGFESSYDEVRSAFGEPVEATDLELTFVTKDGYTITFCFWDEPVWGKRELIAITISCPDSGKNRKINEK